MKEILLVYKILKENATAQIAHLVFVDTQNANPKKPKKLFFADAWAKTTE